jgi:glycosyltransferase involved in cell wall biosynthesis
MKVLFLEAVQNFGGARKSTLELAKGLQNDGVETLIIDFWGSCQPFVDEAKKKNINLDFLDKRDTAIVLSNSNKIKQLQNYSSYFFKWIDYKKILTQKINSFQPDLIVVNNTKTLSLLQKSEAYKIVYFARGWFLPKTISKVNKKMINKKVDIFVGVSQATRQAIFAGGFSKLENIYVVQNSFDFENVKKIKEQNQSIIPWHEENTSREFKILHCGGFLASKGQDLLVDLAKKLKEKKFAFKIMVIGIIYVGQESEKFYTRLIQKIKSENLEEYFDFIINQTNVLKYFDCCDVLIHPTHTEGLPRVAMEAMAFGKPVIGNAVGGMTDYILQDFTGYLTNFNHVDEYVEAVDKLYHNKDKYKFLSENALGLIKSSFSQENQINSFKKILNNK